MRNLHLNAFQGGDGRRRVVEALRSQALIRDEDLAQEIAIRVKVEEVPSGWTLISEGASDSDLFFILSGEFSIVIDGRVVAQKSAGEQVGEMVVVDPIRSRCASVIAASESVVARISESDFSALADKFPRLWRRIAMELANRLRVEDGASHDPAKAGRAA